MQELLLLTFSKPEKKHLPSWLGYTRAKPAICENGIWYLAGLMSHEISQNYRHSQTKAVRLHIQRAD